MPRVLATGLLACLLSSPAAAQQRPLVTGTGNHTNPRWSPDGKRLAYVSTSESGAPQLYVRWMDSGQAARVTGLPDSPQGITWSPDGQRIAYLMTVPDEGLKLGKAPDKPEGAEWAKPLEIIDKVTYRTDGGGYVKPGFDHIFMVDALGGAPRQLTFGAYHDGNPEWTRDGRAILIARAPHDGARRRRGVGGARRRSHDCEGPHLRWPQAGGTRDA